jgi:hypothetical protein
VASAAGDPRERRAVPRYACKARVLIDRDPGVRAMTGSLLDVGVGGCMIHPAADLGKKTGSEIEFTIDSGSTLFRARGVVRSVHGETGALGVSFLSMSTRGKVEFEGLMRELEREKPNRNLRPRQASWDAS